MELVPGTPEYKEAYEAEMKRLETEADPSKKDEKKAETTPGQKDDKEEAKADPVEELRKENADLAKKFEGLNKSLKDTQRWGHENARMNKKLMAELDAERKARTKPAILDANPGLEDAIKHIAEPVERPQDNSWINSIARAIPDVESLLADSTFHVKAEEKRRELGDEWNDPINAIRELNDLKIVHLRDKAVQQATEQARKDFEAKAKKRPAMEVPGGSGGEIDDKKQIDEAERIRTLPKADFDKMRSKVLGM